MYLQGNFIHFFKAKLIVHPEYLEAGKGQEMNPLESPEGMKLCDTLILPSVTYFEPLTFGTIR